MSEAETPYSGNLARNKMRKRVLQMLPLFHFYVTYRGRVVRHPQLDTIPRLQPPPLSWEKMALEVRMSYGGDLDPNSLEVLALILQQQFGPWAAAWLENSLNYYIVHNANPGSSQGWSLHRRRIVLLYVQTEATIHELAHVWEDAKVAESLWNKQEFSLKWVETLNEGNEAWRAWAAGFASQVVFQGIYTETFASIASYSMGDLARIPARLQPYFAPLFGLKSGGPRRPQP